jgi:type VI secretion system secreted protein VgrG
MSDALVAVFQSGALDPDVLSVRAIEARERLSGLFEIELTLVLLDDLPFDEGTVREILQAPAAVGFGQRGEARAPYFGVLREVELVEIVPGRSVVYRAVLVPSLWYATQTVRTRVFQDLTVPEITEAVLREAGLVPGTHVELALRGDYPRREHVVQYEESDFDFVARLLEHEGIFFYFDAASGSDLLVVGDHPGAFRDAEEASVLFRHGLPRPEETVLSALRRTYRVVPRRVVLRDSNWRAPQAPLQGARGRGGPRRPLRRPLPRHARGRQARAGAGRGARRRGAPLPRRGASAHAARGAVLSRGGPPLRRAGRPRARGARGQARP